MPGGWGLGMKPPYPALPEYRGEGIIVGARAGATALRRRVGVVLFHSGGAEDDSGLVKEDQREQERDGGGDDVAGCDRGGDDQEGEVDVPSSRAKLVCLDDADLQ